MKKLKVELENCYGIKKLDYEFDFSARSTYAIYAPNGVMKTSFAKTFLDISNGQTSQDSIFKDRKTKRKITDEVAAEINSANIFVIVPYAQDYKSKKMSTLLVNKELKEKYEKIHADIDEKKEILIDGLKSLVGMKNGIEEAFANDFTHNPKEFFKSIFDWLENMPAKDPLINLSSLAASSIAAPSSMPINTLYKSSIKGGP